MEVDGEPATAIAAVIAISGSSSSERIALVLAVVQAASVLFNNTFCCEYQQLSCKTVL